MFDTILNFCYFIFICFELTNFQNLVFGGIWGLPKYRLGFRRMLGSCLRRPPAVYVHKKTTPQQICLAKSFTLVSIVFVVGSPKLGICLGQTSRGAFSRLSLRGGEGRHVTPPNPPPPPPWMQGWESEL